MNCLPTNAASRGVAARSATLPPRLQLPLLLLLPLLWQSARGQAPSSSWKPNFSPLGGPGQSLYCWKDAQNPNLPHAHDHIGSCGCENTQFRWTDGALYMMESHAHGCDTVFGAIGYNTTRDGDCSYFRVRHMDTGRVLANVSASLGHAFFSATVDYGATPAPRLWVFGPAHARGNKLHPGPCDGDGNWTGCYIGAWSSTDLVHWSDAAVAVPLPDHHAAFNMRVTMVASTNPAAAAASLPAHQAAMVIEPRSDYAFRNGSFRYAVNVGTDGDLSANWQLLPGSAYSESGPGVPPQLNLGAPSMHYDDEEGYYYTIGGGSITAGPVRSRSLAVGSWELSPRAPMAAPAASTAAAGLPATDAALYRGFYTDVWALESAADAATMGAFLANLSSWNYGFTDPDFCCSDGAAPSYLLHTVSQQGRPHNATGKTYQFSGMETYNGTLNEWLRSYFPADNGRRHHAVEA